VKEPDAVDRLMQCVKQAMPLFSVSVHFLVEDYVWFINRLHCCFIVYNNVFNNSSNSNSRSCWLFRCTRTLDTENVVCWNWI